MFELPCVGDLPLSVYCVVLSINIPGQLWELGLEAHLDRMGKEQTVLKHAALLPHEVVGALYEFGSGYFERFLTGGDEVSGNLEY